MSSAMWNARSRRPIPQRLVRPSRLELWVANADGSVWTDLSNVVPAPHALPLTPGSLLDYALPRASWLPGWMRMLDSAHEAFRRNEPDALILLTQVLDALNRIRGDAAIPCQLQLPEPPADQRLVYDQVNLEYETSARSNASQW